MKKSKFCEVQSEKILQEVASSQKPQVCKDKAACTGDYLFDWQGNAVHCLFSGARYTDEPLIHSAYNAWGQRNFVYSNGAGSVSDLLRFGYNARWGYKLDTETGLYYCQHRYYDPANGRWVTRDPLRYFAGDHLYCYSDNRTTNAADPMGLFPWDDAREVLLACVIGGGASALLEIVKGQAGLGSGLSESACKSGINCLSAALGAVVGLLLASNPVLSGCASGFASSVASALGSKLCDPTPCKDFKLTGCDWAQIVVGTLAGCGLGKLDPDTVDGLEAAINAVLSQYLGNVVGEGCKALTD